MQETFVYHVYLGPELMDVFLVFRTVGVVLPDHEVTQHRAEVLGGQLLFCIAEGTGRVAVRLNHQPVET